MDKNEDKNEIGAASGATPAAPTVAEEMAPLKATSASEKKEERSAAPIQDRGARYRPATRMEAAGVVILALYTVASYLQWQALSTTNDLTRESNETTKQVAAANQRLMAESNNLTRQAIGTAMAGVIVAKRQADLGERAFRYQNGASLRMTEVTPYEPIPGQEGEVIAKIENKGHAKATFAVHTKVRIGDLGTLTWRIDQSKRGVDYSIDLASSVSIPIKIRALDAATIAAIKAPNATSEICIYGWIYYTDEAGNTDTAEVCWALSGAEPNWRDCS